MYIILAYFKMFVLCYFFNIDVYMFDKINLLTYLGNVISDFLSARFDLQK